MDKSWIYFQEALIHEYARKSYMAEASRCQQHGDELQADIDIMLRKYDTGRAALLSKADEALVNECFEAYASAQQNVKLAEKHRRSYVKLMRKRRRCREREDRRTVKKIKREKMA